MSPKPCVNSASADSGKGRIMGCGLCLWDSGTGLARTFRAEIGRFASGLSETVCGIIHPGLETASLGVLASLRLAYLPRGLLTNWMRASTYQHETKAGGRNCHCCVMRRRRGLWPGLLLRKGITMEVRT
jgi:hypothetical protein